MAQSLGDILGLILLSIFINECKMRQSVPSASVLVTQNWEEQLTHQRVVVPSRGTLTGWRNGLAGTSRSSKEEKCKALHLRKNNLRDQ